MVKCMSGGDRHEPLYRQIYDRLRARILSGELEVGERLASSRDLAKELRVSRNVVLLAYEQLEAEGYICGRSGSGTYVSEGLAGRREGGHPSSCRASVPPRRPGGRAWMCRRWAAETSRTTSRTVRATCNAFPSSCGNAFFAATPGRPRTRSTRVRSEGATGCAKRSARTSGVHAMCSAILRAS